MYNQCTAIDCKWGLERVSVTSSPIENGLFPASINSSRLSRHLVTILTPPCWNQTTSLSSDCSKSVWFNVAIATTITSQERSCWETALSLLKSGLGGICQSNMSNVGCGVSRHHILLLGHLIGQFITLLQFKNIGGKRGLPRTCWKKGSRARMDFLTNGITNNYFSIEVYGILASWSQ